MRICSYNSGMNTLILSIHILLAITSLAYAAGVVLSTVRHSFEKANTRVTRMWQGTFAAVVTGVTLAVVTHSSIVSACTSSIVLVAVISVAHAYKKIAQQKAL